MQKLCIAHYLIKDFAFTSLTIYANSIYLCIVAVLVALYF